MARKTYLELVNHVLVKLRRESVSSVSSTVYSALIGQLVNEAKRKIEDAWQWRDVRVETAVATVASQKAYSLTGYRERFLVRAIYDSTSRGRLFSRTDEHFDEEEFLTETAPQAWRVFGFDSNGDPQIELSPTPNAVYNLTVVSYNPQDDMTGDTEQLSVPHWPVILEAYALAIAERGEDGGQLHREAQIAASEALGDAIAIDNGNKNLGRASDWTVE
jgi:hypothetical protein